MNTRIWNPKSTIMESASNHNKNENKFINALIDEIVVSIGIKYKIDFKDHLIGSMLKASIEPKIINLLEDYSKLKFEELFDHWSKRLKYDGIELSKESLEVQDIYRFELMPERFIKELLRQKSVELDKKSS